MQCDAHRIASKLESLAKSESESENFVCNVRPSLPRSLALVALSA